MAPPARLTRTIHPQSRPKWGKLTELAPDLAQAMARAAAAGAPGAQNPETMHAIAFADSDGEVHIYVVTEETRKELITDMTGVILQ